MLTEKTYIDRIKAEFEKMQSKDDLLNLLNFVKAIVYGKKAIPFELKQLTYYTLPRLKFDNSRFSPANLPGMDSEDNKVEQNNAPPEINLQAFAFPGRSDHRYRSFAIKKKSGSPRIIHAPVKGLKALQRTLAFTLQCVFEPHKAAMGFAKGKSIVDNARLHEGSKYVYNIDLKDFFPSVDQARVWKCLQLKPFNLVDGEKHVSQEESLKTLKTGIRKFVTEHGESIYYRIQDWSFGLVIDKKGDYEKYKKRLTEHISKPNVRPLSRIKDDRNKFQEYEKQVNDLIFADAKRYLLSIHNVKQLVRLTPSRKNLANIIASLCCTEMVVERKNDLGEWQPVKRNVLPQGAPTSPVITNIVCQRLDYLLSAVAKRFGLKYSRYVDDITFSSMHNVYQPESDFLKELHRIIAEQNFYIKECKTRLQKDGYRKEVTGLLVNEKANVQKRYIKQLRLWLYYWERYGYERAYVFFLQQYLVDKGHVIKGKPDMANVISGKLDYLKMVKGVENELYVKLRERFDHLIQKRDYIADILRVWEEDGIDEAMEVFYSKEVKKNEQI